MQIPRDGPAWQKRRRMMKESRASESHKVKIEVHIMRKRAEKRTISVYAVFLPFRNAFRFARSPSTSHLLALIICKTLTNCLKAMTGAEIPVMIHGQRLSILFALANSMAPALHGLVNRLLGAGCPGLPGVWPSPTGCRRDGESIGEEKERRYRPMKKSSLRAQQMNRTVCGRGLSFVTAHI